MAEPTDAEIAGGLLAYLRAALAEPALEYMEPPARISGGFDTLIYGFRLQNTMAKFWQPLILRIFREGNPWSTVSGPERARLETAAQNTVASLGYSAPRVLLTNAEDEVLGAPFLIMERLPGRIMLDAFFRPSRHWFRLPAVLAETHARLHALDPQPLVQAMEAAGVAARTLTVADWMEQVQRLIDYASLDGLRPGVRWLIEHRPPAPAEGPAICHGDFHPLNILMDKGQVSGVIDWSWVRIADPAYDVGATVALFTQGPVDLPPFLHPIVNWFRRGIVRRYLSTYQRFRSLDTDAVPYYEAMRCLGFLLEARQQRQADVGVMPRPEKPTAFAAPRVVEAIIRRLHQITGVTLTLPPATK